MYNHTQLSKGIGGKTSPKKGIGGKVAKEDTSEKCIVAAAAFGTAWEDEISVLRHYRDTMLRSSSWGRRVISLYYQYGPLMVNTIRKYPLLKRPLRGLIKIAIITFGK